MRVLFTNGKYLLYNNKLDTFEIYLGDIICENNHIQKTNKLYDNIPTINLDGRVVIPTLVNAHLHLGETVFRPLPRKMTLLEYISYTEEYNKAHKDTLETIWLDSAKTTLDESQKYGVMAVNTIRGDNILGKYDINSLSGYPIMNSEKLRKYIHSGIDGYKDFCDRCKNNGIRAGVFLHSFYMNTIESLTMARECYRYSNTFFCTHLAEDYESEEKVVKMWGKRSIDILLDNGLLNDSTILIHGNTLTDEELDTISAHHASLVLCPASANNLKTRLIDIHRLKEHNVNWCIATDGLASGESANLLYQTSLVDGVDSIDMLKAITTNPSKAMKLDGEILAQGSRCNMIVLEDTECKDVHTLCDKIISNNVNIAMVYYNGKLVVDNTKDNGENI